MRWPIAPQQGEEADVSLVCQSCSAELPEGARFCLRCGAPTAAPSPDTSPSDAHIATEGATSATKDRSPSRRRAVIIGLAGAVAVAAVALLLLRGGSSSSVKTQGSTKLSVADKTLGIAETLQKDLCGSKSVTTCD